MRLKPWSQLPADLQCEAVWKYYQHLENKKYGLMLKRLFDVCAALIMLIILSPVILILSALIAMDSPGGVFFRQIRVTTYGREFQIHKFRTMVDGAEQMGSQITTGNDARITKIGLFLRKTKLDELPQLLDVLAGDMSFVGTRPEVPEFVAAYSDEMKATLLLPAGITSEASIRFKDEAEMLEGVEDIDDVYVKDVLPRKMKHNLKAIEDFSFFGELATLFRTVFAVLGKEYADEI